VKALVRALEGRGLLSRETLEHGGAALRLSDEGRRALAEEGSLLPPSSTEKQRELRKAEANSASSSAPSASSAFQAASPATSDPLFAALKQWRRRVADEEGVPSYVVAHDKTLAAIVDAKPTTLPELQAVKGMGPKKVEKYGAEILALLRGGQ
jgi:ATP-dependent DNA helicase RecQ